MGPDRLKFVKYIEGECRDKTDKGADHAARRLDTMATGVHAITTDNPCQQNWSTKVILTVAECIE